MGEKKKKKCGFVGYSNIDKSDGSEESQTIMKRPASQGGEKVKTKQPECVLKRVSYSLRNVNALSSQLKPGRTCQT